MSGKWGQAGTAEAERPWEGLEVTVMAEEQGLPMAFEDDMAARSMRISAVPVDRVGRSTFKRLSSQVPRSQSWEDIPDPNLATSNVMPLHKSPMR